MQHLSFNGSQTEAGCVVGPKIPLTMRGTQTKNKQDVTYL